jgi:uncharacterized membrane protein
MKYNKNWINEFFSQDDLDLIQKSLDRAEAVSRGEIVLSVRKNKKFLEKLYSNHELALKDFDSLKVYNTKEKTGILIFIIFDERYYDIIADEGIFEKIPDEIWNQLEANLKKSFSEKKYSEGLLDIIDRMSNILEKEFPDLQDSINEDEIDDEIKIN